MKISPSLINTFLWCKREFQYRYLEHLPQETTPLMERGIYVHALLSAWIKGEKPPTPPEDNWVRETGNQIFERAIKIFKPRANGLSEVRLIRPYLDTDIVGVIDYFDDEILLDFKVLDKMKTYRSPLQLSMYRYLIGRRRRYYYLHLTINGEKYLEYTDKDLDFYERVWADTIQEIKDYVMEYDLTGKDLPAHRTKYCKKYCPYYKICKEGI